MANNLPWNIHSFHKEEKEFPICRFCAFKWWPPFWGYFIPHPKIQQPTPPGLYEQADEVEQSNACFHVWVLQHLCMCRIFHNLGSRRHQFEPTSPRGGNGPPGDGRSTGSSKRESGGKSGTITDKIPMFRQDPNPKVPKTMTWLCLRMWSIFSVPIPRLNLFLKIGPHIQQELPESGVSLGQNGPKSPKGGPG